jgi:hypothetical protein
MTAPSVAHLYKITDTARGSYYVGKHKNTEQNGNVRKNYAEIGYTYQADIDAFVPPKPFASWVLNDKAQWEAPVAMPTDGKMYSWDEEQKQWTEAKV